jgi:hypothetical protein
MGAFGGPVSAAAGEPAHAAIPIARGAEATAPEGRNLFFGAAALRGRIATHPNMLPGTVLRCANCHAQGRGPDVARSVAPRLDRAWLVEPQARRGGPPTRYDGAAFCTLLRLGQDPAHVLINVQMPRYEIGERECDALWRFLTAEDHG